MSHGSVFPYPGGKARHADWIHAHLPPHECFVDVFGGSGAVLANKPPEGTEVYNDIDDDLVHFFQTLKTRRGELQEWLSAPIYSRSLYEEWADAYHDGYRPNDDVERAGRFLALRFMQFSGRRDMKAGFKTAKANNVARTFANAVDNLDQLAERFREVIIECDDYRAILDRYDGRDTVFYLDPPYVGREAYYSAEGFDHEAFAEALGNLEGAWVVSYDEVPPAVRERGDVIEREVTHQMSDNGTAATERLIVSFPVSSDGQTRLMEVAD